MTRTRTPDGLRLDNDTERAAYLLVQAGGRALTVRQVAEQLDIPEPSARRTLLALVRQDRAYTAEKLDGRTAYRYWPSHEDLSADVVLVGERTDEAAVRMRKCVVCKGGVGYVHQCCTAPGCTTSATGVDDVRRLFGLRRLSAEGLLVSQPWCRECRSNRKANRVRRQETALADEPVAEKKPVPVLVRDCEDWELDNERELNRLARLHPSRAVAQGECRW